MYDVLPHGGPLPPGYGDVYGAAPRAFVTSPGRITVAQAKAVQPLIQKAIKSARSPLAIPDFDTWNVGAGMIEQVPAATTEEESPWYMNKILWAAGGIGLLVGGYFLLRDKGIGIPFKAAGG